MVSARCRPHHRQHPLLQAITELPSVTHVEVINAFLEGTTCRNLVHELARSRPANTNELFDAATNYAAGEEAVGAIFDDKPNKRREFDAETSTKRTWC